MSRGIRNNNPGNIDYSPKNKWLGELPFDPAIESRHCRFTKPEYGIRALFKLLRSYSKYPGKPGVGCGNIDTVEEIIERWAPPKDRNNTEGYITRSVRKPVWVAVTAWMFTINKPRSDWQRLLFRSKMPHNHTPMLYLNRHGLCYDN